VVVGGGLGSSGSGDLDRGVCGCEEQRLRGTAAASFVGGGDGRVVGS
jgi:hypothetical protein